MGVLNKAFWKTLWEDKRILIISVLIIVLLLSILLGGYYSWFQAKRTWNWKVGGYQDRAHEMVCDMAKNGVLIRGPSFSKECD